MQLIEAVKKEEAEGAVKESLEAIEGEIGFVPNGMAVAANSPASLKMMFAMDEAAREVGGVILGLPRNMDGSEGPRCQSTRAFARNLDRLTDLPISYWDERLSTVAAERALLEADATRKRRAEVIDSVAASYILQGVLDRMRHMRAEHDG